MTTPDDGMLTHYSRALDELFQCRRAAAYEAAVIANLLTYATLPKAVRSGLESMYVRLTSIARDDITAAYADVSNSAHQHAMRLAGMRPSLTRGEWEADQ